MSERNSNTTKIETRPDLLRCPPESSLKEILIQQRLKPDYNGVPSIIDYSLKEILIQQRLKRLALCGT